MHLRPRLFFLLLSLPLFLTAQTDTLPAFPEDFRGEWAGELRIYNARGLAMGLPMVLSILPVNDSTWTYTLHYDPEGRNDRREYFIKRGPDGPHHWICDEENSILLDGYYLGDTYQSVFTVMGSYLVNTVRHAGDHLIYAFNSGSDAPVRISGNEVISGDTIPTVNSYKVAGYQRALLYPVRE